MMCEKIKYLRECSDKTQRDMSIILGVSRSTYAGWENGIDAIPLVKLNDICNYFKVSMDFICELADFKTCKFLNNIDKLFIGSRLREIRLFHGDTQDIISNVVKIDQSNYSKYELGKILIPTYTLIEFCKYYNVSMDYICGRDEKSPIYV